MLKMLMLEIYLEYDQPLHKYREQSISMRCIEFVLIFQTFPNGGKMDKILRLEPYFHRAGLISLTDLKYLLKLAENMK